MGQSPKGESVTEYGRGIEFHQGKMHFDKKYIKHSTLVTSEPSKIAPANSVLLCVRAPVGKVNITKHEICIGRGLCSIIPLGNMLSDFVYYFLLNYESILTKQATGTTFIAVTGEVVKNQLFPVPPIQEQIRIVAKIEELIPHIDEYDDKESKINELNSTFPEQLKKSILQDAVQGKLVPQDPSDEPASTLLERIREEKARLVKEGKIKKDKNESVIFRRDNSYYEKSNGVERRIDEEIPFEIPDSWEWVRLKKLGISQTGNTPSKNHPEYFGGFVPFIGPGDIIKYGINTNNKGLSRIGLEFGRLAKAGSILQVCIGGSIGKAAINHVDLAFNQQINSITPIECNEEFLFCTMISPYFVETIKERAGGTATPIINRGEWDNILVPVAPIREQSRIVKTIESILKCFNISLGITSQ